MSTKLILLVLLLAGAGIYISCIDMDPIRSKNRERFKPEGWFEDDHLPLARAIYRGDTQEIKKQVKEQGIDPDTMSANGRIRFLLYACIMEDPKAVKTLLELGADPNKVSPMRMLNAGPESSKNRLPIEFSVSRGNRKIAELLLEYKANPNTPVGLLPVNYAMGHKNDKEWLKLLFRYGADASFKEYGSGENSAQIALTSRRFELISCFLEKGADPLSPNRLGNNLAFNVQGKLKNYRGTEKGRRELEQVKELLISKYGVQFPAQEQTRKGIEGEIRRYENLPKEIKELYGMDSSARYIQRVKDSLAQGKTLSGRLIDN